MMRLIDGDALTEAFYHKMKELLASTITPQISNEALSLLCGAILITEAPTIEPLTRKTGKWLDIGKFTDIEGSYHEVWKCNCCGYMNYEDSNFCPNCGVRMDVE